jgi:ABC-2 type transport system permease protein
MPIGAIAALFFFTIRQMLRDAKFWAVAAVLLLPCALILTIRYFAPPIKSVEPLWEFYHSAVQFMFLMGLLPLACMIYGTGLIGAEAESRTIGYLITRRLRRRTVLLTKFIATALVLAMLGDAALAALHALTVTGHDWPSLAAKSGALADWNPMHDLSVYLGVTALGVVGFLAVFTLIGLLSAKPLALSVFYLVVFELVISNLPVGARAYSLIHQLRVTAAGAIPRLTKLFQLPDELTKRLYPAGGSGVPPALMIVGAALLIAFVLVTIRELTPAKVARD